MNCIYGREQQLPSNYTDTKKGSPLRESLFLFVKMENDLQAKN
jgi:hypothetical protein